MKKRCIVSIALLIFIISSITTNSITIPTNVRLTNIPLLNNEEQAWICPTDSNIIIANWRDFRLGYRQIGLGRSTDGGQTWTDSLIAKPNQYLQEDSKQSDPTLTVDRFGNFYMSVLDYDGFGFTDKSLIAFYKTTDKGLTWTGPVPVPNVVLDDPDIFEDKQFITVDRTAGPYDGNVYCSWTRFNNPDRIVFVRSIDGAASFQDTVIVGPTQTSTGCGASVIDAGQFSIPAVSSNGDVHVFWQGYALDSGGACTGTITIKHVVSTDGGQSFTVEDTILSVSGYMTANGGINTYSQPVVDADITGGPFDGNLYMAFTNTGPEDINFKSDVDFVRSTDNGLSWSDRIQINDALDYENIDSFHPWLFCNTEGVISVVFYDQRNDSPAYMLFDLYAAYSFDGGLTFTSNHRISSASSSPADLFANKAANPEPVTKPWIINEDGSKTPTYVSPMAGLIGEYISVSSFEDKMAAVWTDSRDGNSEVYSANWYIEPLSPRLLTPFNNYDQLGIAPLTFSWATSWKHNDDRYLIQIAEDSLFTLLQVDSYLDTNFMQSTLPVGSYYWRVKCYNTAETDSSDFSPTFTFVINEIPCCLGIRGNIDNDLMDEINIADLVYFVDYSFGNPSGPEPECFDEADVDASTDLDIADIVYLVSYMFGIPSGPAPLICP